MQLREWKDPGVFVPVLFVMASLVAHHSVRGSEQVVFSGPTMGSTYRVVVRGSMSPGMHASTQATLQAELDRIDALMSTYRADSEVARFNASASTDKVPVSLDTVTVVTAAQTISEQSGGALDVTVLPLVGAWGFGSEPSSTLPDDQKVAELLRRVGYRKLSAGNDPAWLQKQQGDVSIDLSAIAPGFAADRLSELLTEQGLPHHLVDVGGELRAAGLAAKGVPWRVGIEEPDRDQRTVHLSMALCSGALATSGDYRNFEEQDGARRSHTIDPRSGRPVEHALASVSVVAPSAMLADGWATALLVLGPVQGRELATRLDLPAYFIVRSPGGFETAATPTFERLRQVADCAP